MGILLAFAPFIAFALVDRLAGPTEGLIAGAAVSAALLLRDVARGQDGQGARDRHGDPVRGPGALRPAGPAVLVGHRRQAGRGRGAAADRARLAGRPPALHLAAR